MMEHEGLPIPLQLPKKPADELFQVLTSYRCGSEWVMTMLDSHPQVCASGEVEKPELGFPTEAMNILGGTPWLPTCSTKLGCTLKFVRDGVWDLTGSGNTTELIPPRCQSDHDGTMDPLPTEHRQRLCNFVRELNGDFTLEAIVIKWVEAFATEDKRLLGCACPRGVRTKGLKIMAGWIAPRGRKAPFIPNLNETLFKGSKIIRLKRSNLWDRFKSLISAQKTNVWHARKDSDMSPGQHFKLKIPIQKMLNNIKFMQDQDESTDAWAKEHGSDVLWVEYKNCKASPTVCRREMMEFLGVHAESLPINNALSSISAFAGSNDPLDKIENKEEVAEALGANGWGGFVGLTNYTELQLLIYETQPLEESPAAGLFRRVSDLKGINATIVGQGSHYSGFGSKYAAAIPVLQRLPPESLVVLSDSRDVITNVHATKAKNGGNENLYATLVAFRNAYIDLTSAFPGAIVVSAEAQCCVSALSHIKPGDLFEEGGSRTGYACASGSPNCLWKGKNNAKPWHSFMLNLAEERSNGERKYVDVYLNAGLIAGKAQDMLRVFNALDIREEEDDQAVLTAFMYHQPGTIVLDYEQIMFGNNRWALAMKGRGCMFDYLPAAGSEDASFLGRRLVHSETGASPLFIHSPGGFNDCHEELFSKLGSGAGQSQKKNSPAGTSRRIQNTNYGDNSDLFGVPTSVSKKTKKSKKKW
jgi:hypothetical protein